MRTIEVDKQKPDKLSDRWRCYTTTHRSNVSHRYG